jgi:hypothetical protein
VYIGVCAFSCCSLLKAINFIGTKEQWKEKEMNDEWSCLSTIETIRCINSEIRL